ncbi:endonuclease/exonuclease/phosphatase family protein [Myceligenerans pegani]|uniref:Endonuclease/exonuclease/phosphatase family protein n=1 Tax=Myceligenerans pegani TaxID=2776917 RepID=A0ABR9MT96_9MICO|nr:endonuclease/exonuclease/phosphatase family protein [Myceligenerans sp. TRM 65318]MBE1874589.1 endonuclease/exonuclease/phosphatase family protein [Myceligenerans sp. TRM 65318]MBE3016860.1 endonuclease/exonuclease/phosphatase family protein [Myceligenerans sp. TRM 65318]
MSDHQYGRPGQPEPHGDPRRAPPSAPPSGGTYDTVPYVERAAPPPSGDTVPYPDPGTTPPPPFDDVFQGEPGVKRRRRGTVWSRGLLLAAAQLVLAAALLFRDQLPGALGLASLVASILPWLGALAALLLLLGLARRSATATLAFLLPAAAWGWVLWPRLTAEPVPRDDLIVVQHNVSDDNRDIAGTVGVLLAARPHVVVLEEVTSPLVEQYTRAFGDALPHREVHGTVGVWSVHPLRDAQEVDLRPDGAGPGWNRGMRVTVVPDDDTPGVAVYAVHLPSMRLGPTGLDVAARNQSVGLLAEVLSADESDAVVVAGDLNATLDDPALEPVTALVSEPRHGLGFTFPAAFPMVPIDHVLARGAAVTEVRTLPRTGSDHLPVVASVDLPWS